MLPDHQVQSLVKLASEWKISFPRPIHISSAPSILTFRTRADDVHAEELVKRHQLKLKNSASFKVSLPGRKRETEIKEVYDTLEEHVRAGASVGITESLLNQLTAAGGDIVSITTKRSNSIGNSSSNSTAVSNPKGSDATSLGRKSLLEHAIANNQPDVATLLAQHANQPMLDAALIEAVLADRSGIVEVLVRFGARFPASSPTTESIFLNVCIGGVQEDIVSVLVASSQTRPSPVCLAKALIEATRQGSFVMVARLLQQGADADYHQAEALRTAIQASRTDLALCLLLAPNQAPSPKHINQSLKELLSSSSSSSPASSQTNLKRNRSEKSRFELLRVLLAAGASGSSLAQAVRQAYAAQQIELLQVLLQSGAPLDAANYQIVREAVSQGQASVVQVLMAAPRPIPPQIASECVALVPVKLPMEARYTILKCLLRLGASGESLSRALVTAVEDCHLESVKLLLTPSLSRSSSSSSSTTTTSSTYSQSDVEKGASINWSNGIAIKLAIKRSQPLLVRLLLSGPSKLAPSLATDVFLLAQSLSGDDKRMIIQSLLSSGVEIPSMVLSGALASELARTNSSSASSHKPVCDRQLVKLYVQYGGDVNHEKGTPLQLALAHRDRDLFMELLAQARPETMAACLPCVIDTVFSTSSHTNNVNRRRDWVAMLLQKEDVTTKGSAYVTQALQKTLDQKPVDMTMAKLLLVRGQANLDLCHGAALLSANKTAVRDPDANVMRYLLKYARPSAETIRKALRVVYQLPPGQTSTTKFDALLTVSDGEWIHDFLVEEVSRLVQLPPAERRLEFVGRLLARGADVNAREGQALCIAVSAADASLFDVLFTSRSSESLQANTATYGRALLSALRIDDASLRTMFVGKLLQAGVTPTDAGRALDDCVARRPDDTFLLKNLMKAAPAYCDGALMTAIARGQVSTVSLLLKSSSAYQSTSIDRAVREAVQSLRTRPTQRFDIVQLLLPWKPSRALLSSLLPAVASEGDYALSTLLIQQGGAVLEESVGAALEGASRSGNPLLLELLLGASTSLQSTSSGSGSVAKNGKSGLDPESLRQAFQAAVQVPDLKMRLVLMNRFLEKGVSGPMVDEQLSAVLHRGLSGQYDAPLQVEMLRVLMQGGADPNFNEGEAIRLAVTHGMVLSVKILLGLDTTRSSVEEGAEPPMSACSTISNSSMVTSAPAQRSAFSMADARRPEMKSNVKRKMPNQTTLAMAFCEAMENVGELDSRFTLVSLLFQAGLSLRGSSDGGGVLHQALTQAISEEEDELDERLISLLLRNGASPWELDGESLFEAARQWDASLLSLLTGNQQTPMPTKATKDMILSSIFARVLSPVYFDEWFSTAGYEVSRVLLEAGAVGEGVDAALYALLKKVTQADEGPSLDQNLASRFLELFTSPARKAVNPNYNGGRMFLLAVAHCLSGWVRGLLRQKPMEMQTLRTAFFSMMASANDTMDGDRTFNETEAADIVCSILAYRSTSGHGIDLTNIIITPETPLLLSVLNRFPRSSATLIPLLAKAGCPLDTPIVMSMGGGMLETEEAASPLLWAILQSADGDSSIISSGTICALIRAGSNVNYTSPASRTTPIMAAVKAQRLDVVRMLVEAGAEVHVEDQLGNTPLVIASLISGTLSMSIMSSLLSAGAPKNDGSIHNAARELNLGAVKTLVQNGHDIDYPSPLHGGRSALGELCLHATDVEGLHSLVRERDMERMMAFLLEGKSDLSIQSDGKSVLLLAMHARDVLGTTRVLLKAGLWKTINEPYHRYTDGQFTYSPTMYVQRVLPETDYKEKLLKLLRESRAVDVYYANQGEQPPDAVGVPEEITRQRADEVARRQQEQREREEFERKLEREKELAALHASLWAEKMEREEEQQKRLKQVELDALQQRAKLEEKAYRKLLKHKQKMQIAEAAHEESLTQERLQHMKALQKAEVRHYSSVAQARAQYGPAGFAQGGGGFPPALPGYAQPWPSIMSDANTANNNNNNNNGGSGLVVMDTTTGMTAPASRLRTYEIDQNTGQMTALPAAPSGPVPILWKTNNGTAVPGYTSAPSVGGGGGGGGLYHLSSGKTRTNSYDSDSGVPRANTMNSAMANNNNGEPPTPAPTVATPAVVPPSVTAGAPRTRRRKTMNHLATHNFGPALHHPKTPITPARAFGRRRTTVYVD